MWLDAFFYLNFHNSICVFKKAVENKNTTDSNIEWKRNFPSLSMWIQYKLMAKRKIEGEKWSNMNHTWSVYRAHPLYYLWHIHGCPSNAQNISHRCTHNRFEQSRNALINITFISFAFNHDYIWMGDGCATMMGHLEIIRRIWMLIYIHRLQQFNTIFLMFEIVEITNTDALHIIDFDLIIEHMPLDAALLYV